MCSSRRSVTRGPGTRFFARAIGVHGAPAEVTTDLSPALARGFTKVLPLALRDTTQYANNRIEKDHGRLKARFRLMRGLKREETAHSKARLCSEPKTRSLRSRCRSSARHDLGGRLR